MWSTVEYSSLFLVLGIQIHWKSVNLSIWTRVLLLFMSLKERLALPVFAFRVYNNRHKIRIETEKRLLHRSLYCRWSNCCSSRSAQQLQHQADRLRNSLEVATGELQQLERSRQSLVGELDSMSGELQRLQAANSSLQKERDRLEDEKEDVLKDLDRQAKENDRWYKFRSICW